MCKNESSCEWDNWGDITSCCLIKWVVISHLDNNKKHSCGRGQCTMRCMCMHIL